MERVFSKFPWIVREHLPQFAGDRDRIKRIVVEEFSEWTPPPNRHSFRVASTDKFFNQLYERFYFECKRYFHPFTIHPASRRDCHAYVQNSERNVSILHDHLRSSSITAVYYLSVPDAAASLSVRYLDHEKTVPVEEGWLYMFPRWLAHKPLPQESPDYRVALNLELISNEYPIARDDGTRW